MTADLFFRTSVERLLVPGKKILDIGAGLRVDPARGNVVDPARAWILPLLNKIEYQVMDPVDTYHPDIVGDLMQAPLANDSYDGAICLAVLEHIPRAWEAAAELHRILKPGGHLLGYVPFLSPYHAMPGYYGDYVRFTDDGIRALFSTFSQVEICHVRGPAETILHLLPSGFKGKLSKWIARQLDAIRPGSGKQASGFFFFCQK
jgi:SAM-dependent methyltransferase